MCELLGSLDCEAGGDVCGFRLFRCGLRSSDRDAVVARRHSSYAVIIHLRERSGVQSGRQDVWSRRV